MNWPCHAATAEAAAIASEAAKVAKDGLQAAGRGCADAGALFLKTNAAFERARTAMLLSRSLLVDSQTRFELLRRAAEEADRCAGAAGAAAEDAYDALLARHTPSFREVGHHAPYELKMLLETLGVGNRPPTPSMFIEFRDCSLGTKQRMLQWYKDEGADYAAKADALASVNDLDRDGEKTVVEASSDDEASIEEQETKRKRFLMRHARAEGPGNAKRAHRARRAKRLRGPSPVTGACACPFGSPPPSPSASRYIGSDASGSDLSDYEAPNRQPIEVEDPETLPQGGAPCLVFCDAEPFALKFHVAPELYVAHSTRIGPAEVQVGTRLSETQSVAAHCVLVQAEAGWQLQGRGDWSVRGLAVDGAPVNTMAAALLPGSRVDFLLDGGVASYTFCV